jgi:hypothetical protein
MSKLRSALVFGYGAVEKTALTWYTTARVVEVKIRLWVVSDGGVPIGVIGKDPWTREGIDAYAESAAAEDALADEIAADGPH